MLAAPRRLRHFSAAVVAAAALCLSVVLVPSSFPHRTVVHGEGGRPAQEVLRWQGSGARTEASADHVISIRSADPRLARGIGRWLQGGNATTAASDADTVLVAGGGCLATEVQAALEAAEATAATCKVLKITTLPASSEGKTELFTATLTAGGCAAMPMLIYGIMTGGTGGIGLAALAVLGITLVLFPFATCKVATRRCRRMCRCCREGAEIRYMGKCKKITIFLLSVAGLGGMIAIAMLGVLGDVYGGTVYAESANCAATTFMMTALNGGPSTSGTGRFLGFATAAKEANALSSSISIILPKGVQAANADGDATQKIQEASALLAHIQTTLGSQITVAGSKCTFCDLCCGTGLLVPKIEAAMQTGIPLLVPKVTGELKGYSGRLSTAGAAATTAAETLGQVQTSIETGPVGAMIVGASFFNDPLQGYLSMGFDFGARVLGGIGLIFVFYGLKWLPCCGKLRIGRKDHPAPQWAACGWCGGCLGAIVGCALGLMCFAVAAVSSDICIFVGKVGTDAGMTEYSKYLGLEAQMAQSASLACYGEGAASRDIYATLGLSAPMQGITALNADVKAVVQGSFAATLAKYTDLDQQAQLVQTFTCA
ncbi:unnamed protein product [Polarella glacialis]|uniref:Uncharacterized protein n=1 Tax=Polarella glacialis TaxID=89957 RepID=A0A813GYU2_POLGL|nr:unnamed protein product [Polarella glacialis]